MRDRSKDAPKSAAELMRELRSDPGFRAREQQREIERASNTENYRQVAEPLLRALNDAGVGVAQLADLRHRPADYPRAVPILMAWLERLPDDAVKEDVIRTLSVPEAKMATGVLIRQFSQVDDPAGTGLRWAIANALAVLADDSVFNEIEALARDRRWGRAREMLALALSNMRDARAVPVLIALLEDDETAGHAAMALGRLRAVGARPALERLKAHPREWIREEVAKALANMP